jgi:hypothetical protein
MSRLALIVVVLMACGAAPFAFSALQNNHRLNKLEDRFLALRQPPRSELVRRFSKVGLLHYGNGNACSYMVGEVRSAPGDLGPVLAAYHGMEIEGAAEQARGGARKCAIRAGALGPDFEASGAEAFGFHDEATMREVASLAKSRHDLYLVVCADTGYPTGFDLRCR